MRFKIPNLALKSPLFYYTFILAGLGVLLVFLVPPFQSPDEQTHFYRAYQLSEGHLIANRLSYGAGDTLPKSLSDSFNSFYYLLFQPDKKIDINSFKTVLGKSLNSTSTVETRFENTAPYPPFAYLPQII